MPSNLARSIAVLAIVMHHWLLFLSWNNSTFMSAPLSVLRGITGTFVHVFFVLSGYGLFLSYKKTPRAWHTWTLHRARKILLPYWFIVSLTFLLVNIMSYDYSWQTLLAYLTFTRNFYEPSWSLNPTLWFMPVIVGLYLLFPLFFKVLEAYGSKVLLAMSLAITYGYICACVAFGHIPEHQNAFFLAYSAEFSLGMILAHAFITKPHRFYWLFTPKAFWCGAFVYGLSAAISAKWQYGSSFNDIFTAFGLSIMFMSVGKIMAKANLHRLSTSLADASYTIYLIHGPIIIFLIKPIWNGNATALWTLVSGIAFSLVISILTCVGLSQWARLVRFSNQHTTEN